MQVSDIDISLSHGQLFGKKQWTTILLFMIAPFILEIVTIILFIVPFVVPDAEFEAPIIIIILFGNILFLSLLTFFISIKVKDYKLKKRVSLWLDDAVETKAYSKQTGEQKLPFLPKGITIQVKFEIEGKKYVRDSGIKVFGGGKGYLATFKKYADREINILYSPKYDEVLILKDKTE